MKEATQLAVERYSKLVRQEIDREEAAKLHAAHNKERLADGYWEARHHAQLKLYAAVALLKAVIEDDEL